MENDPRKIYVMDSISPGLCHLYRWFKNDELSSRVASWLTKADAERMAAIWNECAGFDDPAAMMHELIINLVNMTARAKDQYDYRPQLPNDIQRAVDLIAKLGTIDA